MVSNPRVVETGPAETRELELPGGSSVLLRPLSRLTYSADAAPIMLAALDGEAVLEVVTGSTWGVNSNGGMAFLSAGTYGLLSPVNGTELKISIARGEALVRTDTLARFGDGQFVVLNRVPPSVRATRDPTGFARASR